MDYRDHDRRVWQQIFSDVPEEWFGAPPSHAMRWTRRFLDQTEPDRILDVGCGIGRWSVHLARGGVGQEIVGVDYAERGAVICRQWADSLQLRRLRFACADGTSLPFRASAFDGVVAALLLDNLSRHDMERAMVEITRVARPQSRGAFVFNPRFTVEQLAAIEASENPTKDCYGVNYEDAEIEAKLAPWVVETRTVSEEGFRCFGCRLEA